MIHCINKESDVIYSEKKKNEKFDKRVWKWYVSMYLRVRLNKNNTAIQNIYIYIFKYEK